MASRYSVFLTTSVEAQLRNAPPQLQGYVAGIVAVLRADPTAASVVFDIIEGERYRTIIFPEGRGFLDGGAPHRGRVSVGRRPEAGLARRAASDQGRRSASTQNSFPSGSARTTQL